jgi:hypothetical protein
MNTKRYDTIHAIAQVATSRHSGMSSRGYRLACRAIRWLKRHGLDRPIDRQLSPRGVHIADDIAARYADRL